MNEEKLLNAIAALLEKELGEMRDELNGINNRLDKLEAGQQSMSQSIKDLHSEMKSEFASTHVTTGEIIEAMGTMLDSKLSAFAHELKWTKDATAQNSMDIAALKKRS